MLITTKTFYWRSNGLLYILPWTSTLKESIYHLKSEFIIQLRLKDGCSLRAIARELNCSPSTISYEVKRGTVELYHAKSKDIRLLKGMMHIKLIVKIVGVNQTFSKKINLFTMSTNISLKTVGRLMFAVIVPLLLANSLAAMLSAPNSL